MRKWLGIGVAALLACAATATAGQASAANNIINLSATGLPFQVTFSPGWYEFRWIGTADGGRYDGANVSCGDPSCTTGWNEAFVSFDQDAVAAINHGTDGEYDDFTTGLGPVYASAAAALSAYQAGAVLHVSLPIVAGAIQASPATNVQKVSIPVQFYTDGTPLILAVADPDQDSTNNFGGVSLEVTSIANPTGVPEPGAWAMLLLGFAGLGAALRGRRWAPETTAA